MDDVIELTEAEILRGKPMPSRNHSILEVRISHLIMDQYESTFDVLTELDLDLTYGTAIPDICIYPKLKFNWEDDDIIKMTTPPITTIEILSPRQAYEVLASKIRKVYFPSGVQSAWIVMPSVKTIQLFLPNDSIQYFRDNIFKDITTGIELDLKTVFK
ncbi:Uma2 family endonuclease [Larkinella sp. C7]|uniref:Uma2 family endonuclease n=1 Tax=Larkinella sp. C7 TaxID=2576607 RepID=UPI001111599B|nr:Uma2 family endonuclease [Larkinella sp. C7]